MGCSASPPTISPKIIKNLGAAFCGLDPADLTTEKLNIQPAKKKAMGKEPKLSTSTSSCSSNIPRPMKQKKDVGKKTSKKNSSAGPSSHDENAHGPL